MVTDTQAGGGLSLPGPPLKNHKPAHHPMAEARSASKAAFAAILAETDPEAVEGGAPVMPTSGEERPETAPSGPVHITTEKTEGSVSSRAPDTKRGDAGGAGADRLRPVTTATPADGTETLEGLALTPEEAPPPKTTGKTVAGHAMMSVPSELSERSSQAAPPLGMTAKGTAMDGPTGAAKAFAREIGERGRFPAAPNDTTVSAKPDADERHGEPKTAPIAERRLQTGVAPLPAPTNAVDSTSESIAPVHGRLTLARPSGIGVSVAALQPTIAPTLAGVAGIASRDAPLLPGGLSRSESVFALPTLSTPESAKRSGDGTGPGRPNGSAVTQAFSLPGMTYSGPVPGTGGPALSSFGPLPRSEHAQTSDAGPTVPDMRFSGQHASATSPAAPAAAYRHDLPQQVVVQIAAAVEMGRTGTQKTIDLSLNPEELGRVRLRLSPSESGLNVVIVADRSETLELLRRNIDMLAREFLDIGYEDASFDFAGGQQEQADGHASIPLPPASDAPGAAPPVQTGETHVLALGERLDIRL